ncbi:uncharacterized protein LOC108626532 isoform X2 [Ceratina calcarata]|uniref:Uncharacterized protein LOC108626532 isoform X2 n=1 Tax=Ceratina calcarata TaxID=156304 RepID=A0AAJ7S4C9_9HYME|nr:uncharacterized protein LOC108626532 isoform X2 [Ceratina calcarata]
MLKRKDQLKKWEESIKSCGTIFDKYALIDSWTYDRFVEARNNYHQVTTRNLQQWALAAAAQFQSESLIFKASAAWVDKFKRRHRIRQRKIVKYVSHKECVTVE